MGNTGFSSKAIASKGKQVRKALVTASPLLVSDFGWSAEEAEQTRVRLAALAEDWEASGMEEYDHL